MTTPQEDADDLALYDPKRLGPHTFNPYLFHHDRICLFCKGPVRDEGSLHPVCREIIEGPEEGTPIRTRQIYKHNLALDDHRRNGTPHPGPLPGPWSH